MKGCVTHRKGDPKDRWTLKYDVPRQPGEPRKVRWATVWCAGKREAQARLRELLSQVDKGQHVDPSKTTVAEWIETWMESHNPDLGQKSRERYAELLRIHVVPMIGATQIQKLKTADVATLYAGSALGPATRLYVHRVLRKCLSAAVSCGVTSRNPTDGLKAPKIESGTPEQYAGLLEKLPAVRRATDGSDIHLLVALAMATGARRGELLGLAWNHVNLERAWIRIEASVEETKKAGTKIKDTLKTKTSRRTITLDPNTVALLSKERTLQLELALKHGRRMAENGLVFARSILEQRQPRNPRAITKRFAQLMTAAGIADFHLHSLRHAHASYLLSEGVPVTTVSKRLGHANVATTLNVYGHDTTEGRDKAKLAAEKMVRAWNEQ